MGLLYTRPRTLLPNFMILTEMANLLSAHEFRGRLAGNVPRRGRQCASLTFYFSLSLSLRLQQST